MNESLKQKLLKKHADLIDEDGHPDRMTTQDFIDYLEALAEDIESRLEAARDDVKRRRPFGP